MSMSVTWHSFDLKTGRRGPQVNTKTQGKFGRIIGEATETTQSVQCYDDRFDPGESETAAGAVPGWDAATLPGRVMLVALNEEDMPEWGGMVLRRRSTFDSWVDLDLATLEGYLDRRFVRDHSYKQVAQGVIVEGILTTDVIPTGVQFIIDSQSAKVRDRIYGDDEDKTVLTVLEDLMAVEGGPEFTIDLEWTDSTHTVLNRILRVRDRIGTGSTRPVTRFEMPGSVTGGDYVEDFSADNGANDVMATSSGEGEVRPESVHQVADDLLNNGWVRFERRFEPSTSITDLDTLNAHARADLLDKRNGVAELTLVARMDVAPRVGRDFHLGDDVSAVLTNPRFPAQVGPDGNIVPGYQQVVRLVGYETDYDSMTLTPTLWEGGGSWVNSGGSTGAQGG